MAEAVVYVLKLSNVQKQDVECNRRIVLVFADQLSQDVGEMLAVRQVGERIVKGGVLKILFALTQCFVGLFFLFERDGQLRSVPLGFAAARSLGLGFFTLGILGFCDRGVYLRDRLPVS